MFWILLCMIVCLMVLWDIQFRWKYRSLYQFPGPMDIPLLGAVFHFYPNKRTLPDLFSLVEHYGRIVRIAVGRQMGLLITDLEMIEFFLRSQKFTAKADLYVFLKPWLGKGVFMAEDLALGTKTNVQNDENQEFLNAMHFMSYFGTERALSIWKRFDFLYQLSSLYKKQLKHLKTIDDFSITVIEKRRELLLNNNATQSSKSTDDFNRKNGKNVYLDILLTNTINGESLSNEKIKIEVNNAIFGGHDTTSSSISTMMYELANNKRVQDKIVAELKEIYGNDRDKPVSLQDLSEMRYMDLVIKEILRFYGVGPLIGRRVTEDVNYKGTIIPKGTNLGFFLNGIHRSPANYKNHNEFIPERFESKNSENPYSFIPFSAGPRNCPGQQFAINEMKVTFANLLRYFELESAGPDFKMDLDFQLVMKPVSGTYVKIKSRNF